MEAGSTSGSLHKDLVVRLPSGRGIVDTASPSSLPSSQVPSITCGTNLVLCICPLWCANSVLSARKFHLPEQLQFTIFNYINNIRVTTDDVSKGLIGLCQTRTVQRFWA